MANSKIQNSYLCHVTKLMTSLGSFQKEKYFYAFDQCFRHVLDKALQNPENMSTLSNLGGGGGIRLNGELFSVTPKRLKIL